MVLVVEKMGRPSSPNKDTEEKLRLLGDVLVAELSKKARLLKRARF